MLYILLFVITLMPAHCAYSMLSAPLATCAASGNSSFVGRYDQGTQCLIQPSKHELGSSHLNLALLKDLPMNIRAAIIRDDVLKAVDEGDTAKVMAGFSGFMNWLLPHEYYRASVAYTLLHATKKSPKLSGAIVKELLTRVDASDIIEPDQLMMAAMDNNHAVILEFMQKVDPKRSAGMLAIEILKGNPNRVIALLKAGVQPVNNPELKLPYVLLQIALDSFELPLNRVSADSRLSVLDTLLKYTKSLPTSHDFDLSNVPAALQERVMNSIKSKQVTACNALVEVKETPLHTAARENNYAKCFAYLTSWFGPLNKDEIFPLETISILRLANFASPEYKDARKKLAQFPKSFQKIMEKRLDLTKDQLQAQDSQGNTAYAVAKLYNVSPKVIDLLDPNNQHKAKLVILSSATNPLVKGADRVIIPTELSRIPGLSKLNPKKDAATIEAVSTAHAHLLNLVREFELMNNQPEQKHKYAPEVIRIEIESAHSKLIKLMKNLEQVTDHGITDTIVDNLQQRTDITKYGLRISFGPMPQDPEGPSYKVGDFVVENGHVLKIGSINKEK